MQKGTTRKILFITIFVSILLAGCSRHQYSCQGYIEGKFAYLASAVSGNLLKLYVDRGGEVKQNQELFVLDSEPELSKLKQITAQNLADKEQLLNLKTGQRVTIIESIMAQREQAQANLELANKTYKRYQELLKTGSIDKATFDAAKSNHQAVKQKVSEVEANLAEAKLGARAQLIAAQEAVVEASTAAVKQAQWALDQKVVRAPNTGTIFDTLYLLGEFVPAGQPVVILVRPELTKLVFFVPPKIVAKIKMNGEITYRCDGCRTARKAKIFFISPEAEYTPPVIFSKDTRDKLVFRVEALPAPADANKLHLGQPVDVILPLAEKI